MPARLVDDAVDPLFECLGLSRESLRPEFRHPEPVTRLVVEDANDIEVGAKRLG